MKQQIPRLRMFAGPNGSGKSTIKSVISQDLLGIYINPDEIEEEIRRMDFLDLENYKIHTTENEILSFFLNSKLLSNLDLLDDVAMLSFNDQKLSFFNVSVNAYFASVCADFIRNKLLRQGDSFTFETVMSSYDKVEFLKLARSLGYRTYLYYIATNDPLINISRVKQRVSFGGHDVPADKIVSRYTRSLENLWAAIQQTSRAYIFDNSKNEHSWLCEITDAKDVNILQKSVPQWFYKYVVNHFQ